MTDEEIKSRIFADLCAAGAVAVGVADASAVPYEVWHTVSEWLTDGRHGELAYMANHSDLRRDPRLLLEGAQSVVCVAWPYLPPQLRHDTEPFIARYAYAPDYHKSIRRILKPLISQWQKEYDIQTRVCIDSAPVLERYWAVKSGLGFLGRNGCLIVPKYGSWVFLTEILITKHLHPDASCTDKCMGCGLCIKHCPTGALGDDGHLDCRKCLSALTLEMPGGAPQGKATLAGCDRCQEVCPHNKIATPHAIAAFEPVKEILTLTASDLMTMDEATFKSRFAGTSLYRLGLKGLKSNLAKCCLP